MWNRFQLPSGGSGGRDAEHKVKLRGIIIPIVLVLWAAINAVTGQALWPVLRGRHLSAVWVTDFVHVAAAACVKLGIAVACFGWYFMANREEWSYWSLLVTLAGCALAVLSFVLGSLAILW